MAGKERAGYPLSFPDPLPWGDGAFWQVPTGKTRGQPQIKPSKGRPQSNMMPQFSPRRLDNGKGIDQEARFAS